MDGDYLIFESNRYSRKGFLFKNFVTNAIVSCVITLEYSFCDLWPILENKVWIMSEFEIWFQSLFQR